MRVWFSTTLAYIDSIVSFSTKPLVNYFVLNISSRYGNTYKHTRDLPTVYKSTKRARLRNQCIQKGGLHPSVWQTSLISTLSYVFWNSRASKFKHHSWKQKKIPPSLKAFQGLIWYPRSTKCSEKGIQSCCQSGLL